MQSDGGDTAEDDEEEYSQALSCELVFTAKLPSTLPFPTGKVREPSASKSSPVITTTTWCSVKKRLYIGLSNGDLCFWPLERDGASTLRYVGSHKGGVTCICIPKKGDGELGASYLLLSGSVDGLIKIWDFQGKVGSQPTVCVQTLYGHTGTITGLFTYDQYILSSSTDKTIKAWKAVPGREQLVYPWYNLQATPVTLSAWVRCMSYDRSREVGDMGSFWAADDDGGIVRIVPYTVLDLEDRTHKELVFGVPGHQSGQSSLYGSGSVSDTGAPVPHAIPVTHDRGVLMVRYVADWHLLLTLCYDNCLRCYDSDTGDVRHTWQNENGCLFLDLEVDVEHKEVLTVDQYGILSIFSLRAGALLATKTVAQSKVVKIAAVLARHTYAVLTERELSVWYLNHDLDYNLLRGGHTRAVLSLYACTGGAGAHPNDKDYRIFSAGMDNTLRLWDPYDMACVRVHEESQSEVTAMTFYEAWNILVTGHDNGDIRLWDLDTGPWATLQQHTNTVTSLVLAIIRKNEELLISGGYDGLVVLWDIRTLRNEPPHMIAKFRAHGIEPQKALTTIPHAAQRAALSPLLGGGRPGSRERPGSPSVKELEKLIPALTPLDPDPVEEDHPPTPAGNSSHRGLAHSLSSTSHHTSVTEAHGLRRTASTRAPSAGRTATASALVSEAGHQTLTIQAGSDAAGATAAKERPPPSALDLVLAQSRAAAARRDAEAAAEAAAAAASASGVDDSGCSVAPRYPDRARGVGSAHPAAGAASAVGGGGDMLDLLALEPEVLVVQFDMAKKVIITGGNDHIIKVWSANGYAQLGQHLGHTEAVTCLTLDSNLLFSGSEDCTIRVWDTVPTAASTTTNTSGGGGLGQEWQHPSLSGGPAVSKNEPVSAFTSNPLKTLSGHTRCVTGLAVAPRGGHLLSCSLDGSLRLWDYVTGMTVAKFTHHEEMRCLTLRTDKPEVLIGTNQASILRYSIDSITPVGSSEAATATVPALNLPQPPRLPSASVAHTSHQSCTVQDTGVSDQTAEAAVESQHLLPGSRGSSAAERSDATATSSTTHTPLATSARATSDLSARSGNSTDRSRGTGGVSRPDSTAALTGAWDGSVASRGRVFGTGPAATAGSQGVGTGGTVDPWRWGSAKVQLLPKDAPKPSAADMLNALDRQRHGSSPGQLKPGSRSSVMSNQMTRL